MTEQEKLQIDSMSYATMLHHVGFDPPGSRYFMLGTALSDYFDQAFKRKRLEVGFEGAVAASKSIGWGK